MKPITTRVNESSLTGTPRRTTGDRSSLAPQHDLAHKCLYTRARPPAQRATEAEHSRWCTRKIGELRTRAALDAPGGRSGSGRRQAAGKTASADGAQGLCQQAVSCPVRCPLSTPVADHQTEALARQDASLGA
jgi:hypothetical protein